MLRAAAPPSHVRRMELPLFYAGLALDRMTEGGGDADWLRQLFNDPRARLAPVWRTRNLVADGEAPAAIFLSPRELQLDHSSAVLLGVADDVAYFMADLSHLEEA